MIGFHVLFGFEKGTFFKFCVIGCINTLLNYVVFWVFLNELKIHYLVSGGIGLLCGAASGFYLNRLITFKKYISAKKGLPVYMVIALIILIFHNTTQYLAKTQLGTPEEFTQIFGIVVSTCINFTLVKKLVFRNR